MERVDGEVLIGSFVGWDFCGVGSVEELLRCEGVCTIGSNMR